MANGRPGALTPELQATIIGLIKDGLKYRDACLAAGIGKTTFYRWKARGAKAKRGKFRDFWDAVDHARVHYKRARLETIRDASLKPSIEERVHKRRTPTKERDAKGEIIYEEVSDMVRITKPPTWQPAARLLELVFPKEYGRQVHKHTGKIDQEHSGSIKVDAPPARFRWPDGSIRDTVPLETPEVVAAHAGRIPEATEAVDGGTGEETDDPPQS